MPEKAKETWGVGGTYDQYVGRWSRVIAGEFLRWLELPTQQVWSDVGCGTGALVEGILHHLEPGSVRAIDRAKGFVVDAANRIRDARVLFAIADAAALPWRDHSGDTTISGLVLNFVPDAATMLQEMVRVTRSGGRVAVYVWDYSGGMQMMRHFWDAALRVNPEDAALDQAERFPICRPEPLRDLFLAAGLTSVQVRAIEVPTVFRDFDDYWSPFLGGQGAAPTYLASLAPEKREQIRNSLRERLVPAADGSIQLTATAWAVQGIV